MELTNGLNDFCSINFLCNQICSIFTVQSFFVQSTWNRNSGAGFREVVKRKCGEFLTKNQHFPHILSTYSPHSINILPIPTNCQLLTNIFPTNSPCLNNSSLFSNIDINILSSGQCKGSLWGECGEYRVGQKNVG